MYQAQVFGGEGYSAPFDHLALGVAADGDRLVDVGFGASFLEPLAMTPGVEQTDPTGRYRITAGADPVVEQETDEGWRPMYRLDRTPCALSEFEPRCRWQQTSPDSHFIGRRTCSRATPDGRITLAADRLIVTTKDERTETPIDDDDAFDAALATHFGVRL